jgi:hypothetical protein
VAVHGTTIQYRVFGGRPFGFKLTQRGLREEIRHEARQAIDAEIGADNVVSIVEHSGTFEAFSVVVWYRVDSPDA